MGNRDTMGKKGIRRRNRHCNPDERDLLSGVGAPIPLQTEAGLCLPSPGAWDIMPPLSWAINLLLLLGITRLNLYPQQELRVCSWKRHDSSGTSGRDVVFLPLGGGDSGSSTILLAANTAILSIAFTCFKQRNATRELFAIATILSLGTMVQYAFIFMIPAYIALQPPSNVCASRRRSLSSSAWSPLIGLESVSESYRCPIFRCLIYPACFPA